MIVNVCTTVCILRAFLKKGEPWVKAFHFCFGVGAFTTPLLLKQFGAQAYIGYAILSLPVVVFLLGWKQLEEGVPVAEQTIVNEETAINESTVAEDKELIKKDLEIPLRFDLLAACFLMCSTGNEGIFGGWITSYGTIGDRMPLDQALLGESIYWISMTAGRGLVIPLSLLLTNARQLAILVLGIFLSILAGNLLSWFELYDVVVYGLSAVMGLFMSGVYPLTMSLPASLGLTVSPTNTSRYAMGGCVGTAVFPYLVGIVMASFGADSMFWCMAVLAAAMGFVFWKLRSEGELLRRRQKIIAVAEHVEA